MESLNEIKDSYHLLPFDVRPGQYMNTWSKIDRDTVIEYSFKQNDKITTYNLLYYYKMTSF